MSIPDLKYAKSKVISMFTFLLFHVPFNFQVIWKLTNKLGVGKSVSSSGVTIVVCLYDPAGNVNGKFAENVNPSNLVRVAEDASLLNANFLG